MGGGHHHHHHRHHRRSSSLASGLIPSESPSSRFLEWFLKNGGRIHPAIAIRNFDDEELKIRNNPPLTGSTGGATGAGAGTGTGEGTSAGIGNETIGSGGVEFSKLEMAERERRKALGMMGRGMVAMQDIPADSTLFILPRTLVLSLRTSHLPLLLPSQKLHRLKKGGNGWTALIVTLMWEFLEGRRKRRVDGDGDGVVVGGERKEASVNGKDKGKEKEKETGGEDEQPEDKKKQKEKGKKRDSLSSSSSVISEGSPLETQKEKGKGKKRKGKGKKGKEKKWKEYFDILPEHFSTPMFWSPEELSELDGCTVKEKIGKAEAEKDYWEVARPIIESEPTIFSPHLLPSYSLDLYHRMGSLILSRSFHVAEHVSSGTSSGGGGSSDHENVNQNENENGMDDDDGDDSDEESDEEDSEEEDDGGGESGVEDEKGKENNDDGSAAKREEATNNEFEHLKAHDSTNTTTTTTTTATTASTSTESKDKMCENDGKDEIPAGSPPAEVPLVGDSKQPSTSSAPTTTITATAVENRLQPEGDWDVGDDDDENLDGDGDIKMMMNDEDEDEEEDDEDDDEPVEDVGMVPMADILNARSGCGNARLFYEKNTLHMMSTTRILSGTQIFNTYGDPPNSDLLRRYGHIDYTLLDTTVYIDHDSTGGQPQVRSVAARTVDGSSGVPDLGPTTTPLLGTGSTTTTVMEHGKGEGMQKAEEGKDKDKDNGSVITEDAPLPPSTIPQPETITTAIKPSTITSSSSPPATFRTWVSVPANKFDLVDIPGDLVADVVMGGGVAAADVDGCGVVNGSEKEVAEEVVRGSGSGSAGATIGKGWSEEEKKERIETMLELIEEDTFTLTLQNQPIQFPPLLLSTITLFSCPKKDFQSFKNNEKIPKGKLSPELGPLLEEIVRRRLGMYRTTIEEDEQLLLNASCNPIPDRKRHAILVRISEKKILTLAIENMRTKISEMMEQQRRRREEEEEKQQQQANGKKKKGAVAKGGGKGKRKSDVGADDGGKKGKRARK